MLFYSFGMMMRRLSVGQKLFSSSLLPVFVLGMQRRSVVSIADYAAKKLVVVPPGKEEAVQVFVGSQIDELQNVLKWTIDPTHTERETARSNEEFLLHYGNRVLDMSIRSFIVSRMKFLPDPALDFVCQTLLSFNDLNRASQDLGINPYITAITVDNKTIPTKTIPAYHLTRMRGYSMHLLIGLIAKIHGLDTAQLCAHYWVLPQMNSADEHKVYMMGFLEQYLANKNPIKELKETMAQMNLVGWEFRDIPTEMEKSHQGKQRHKIMMRYAAIFRSGVYLGDHKMEEGIGPTKKLANEAAAKNLLFLHWTWPVSKGKSPILLFYEQYLKEMMRTKRENGIDKE